MRELSADVVTAPLRRWLGAPGGVAAHIVLHLPDDDPLVRLTDEAGGNVDVGDATVLGILGIEAVQA
jgi:hypothetical protein